LRTILINVGGTAPCSIKGILRITIVAAKLECPDPAK
jgi:hypothetical protein